MLNGPFQQITTILPAAGIALEVQSGYSPSVSESAIAEVPAARELAPPDLVARAEALVRAFPNCFWYWHPEAKIRYRDDLRQVVLQLRKHGNRKAWLAAQEFHKCL